MIVYFTNYEEHDYKVGLKALSKYNRLAYKYILFTVLKDLRHGQFLGEHLSDNVYKVTLPCSEKFQRVYGELYLLYRVEGHQVSLLTIEPFNTLKALYNKIVTVIDGIPITNQRDAFKLQYLKYEKRIIDEHR